MVSQGNESDPNNTLDNTLVTVSANNRSTVDRLSVDFRLVVVVYLSEEVFVVLL